MVELIFFKCSSGEFVTGFLCHQLYYNVSWPHASLQ